MKAVNVVLCTDGALLDSRRRLPAETDVLLLPELFNGGYRAIQRAEPPVTFRHPLLSRLRVTSATSTTIVAGSLYVHHLTPAPTNTSLVFSKGKVIHRYDKIHLFRPTGDARYFLPGSRPIRPFNITVGRGTLRAGVVICYDLRFPELVRMLAMQGAQVLFVPARWPRVRDEAWHSLLKARAIENQIFVIGCNSADSEGGYSYVLDPMGRCIFSNRSGGKRGVFPVRLDLALMNEARSLHNNLKEAVVLRQLLKHASRR